MEEKNDEDDDKIRESVNVSIEKVRILYNIIILYNVEYNVLNIN